MKLSPRRIWGVLLRQTYVLYHSPPSVINIVAWPMLNVLIWGFMNTYLAQAYGGPAYLAGNLLASAIIWESYIRCSWGTTGCLDEEFTSRNLGMMMATAASLGDYILAFMLNSLLKATVALLLVGMVVKLAFHFSILSLGPSLFLYFLPVAGFGYAIGFFMSTLLFRWGKRAEPLCWFTPVMLAFVMCPYYPVSVLPHSLQAIAYLLPPTWIFESLRTVMAGNPVPLYEIAMAFGLAGLWLAFSLAVFCLAVEGARKRGRLLDTGD